MRKLSSVSAMLLTLGLLTACQTTPTTGITVDGVCLLWTPADYSAKEDSKQTVDGNRALNAKRDAFCG